MRELWLFSTDHVLKTHAAEFIDELITPWTKSIVIEDNEAEGRWLDPDFSQGWIELPETEERYDSQIRSLSFTESISPSKLLEVENYIDFE